MASNNNQQHASARPAHAQRGVSLVRAIVGLAVVAFIAVTGAKLVPAYTEYASVGKVLRAMEAAGETKGSVSEIRRAFERRNVIEGITSITKDDLDITKERGEVVITAAWSKKVPVAGNVSLCLDFIVTNR